MPDDEWGDEDEPVPVDGETAGPADDAPDAAVEAAEEAEARRDDLEDGDPDAEIGQPEVGSEVDTDPDGELAETESDETVEALVADSAERLVKDVYNIGQFVGVTEEPPFLVAVPESEVARVQSVYVQPPGLSEWLLSPQRSGDERIFVVTGEDYSGKVATAIWLALRCVGGRADLLDLVKFRRSGAGSPTLERYLLGEQAGRRRIRGRHTVYLASDFVTQGLISERHLFDSREELRTRFETLGAYAVLTCERLAMGPNLHPIEQIALGEVDLDEVFHSHLRRAEQGFDAPPLHPKVVAGATALWPELREDFRFPTQVRSFTFLLCHLGAGAGDEEIRQAAAGALEMGHPHLQTWFRRELGPNQRLYSLLVYLFQGIDRQDLDRIYTAAVEYLRAEGVADIQDPRQIGEGDLLSDIHARVEISDLPVIPASAGQGNREDDSEEGDEEDDSEGGDEDDRGDPQDEDGASNDEEESGRPLQQVVVFAEKAVEQEVGRQIQNYSRLLWSLQPVLERLAQDESGWEGWRFRKLLGTAIGRFGTTDRDRMLDLLLRLVENRSNEVKAVAGAAMGHALAFDPGFRRLGLQTLAEWAQHERPVLIWASVLAIWRAYYGVMEAVDEQRERDDASVKELREALLRLLDEVFRLDLAQDRSRVERVAARIDAQRLDWGKRIHHAKLLLNREKAQILGGVVYAVRMIARVDPATAARLVDKWLRENAAEGQFRLAVDRRIDPVVARGRVDVPADVAAAIALFAEIGDLKPHGQVVEAFQDLLPPLLARIESLEILAGVMHRLRAWHAWPAVRQASMNHLLRMVNRCQRETAFQLGFAIVNYWLDDPRSPKDTCRLGELLLARILAMDGSPVEIPGHKLGLVLLDASDAQAHRRVQEVGRRVHWLLRSMIDTEVRPLGGGGVLVGRGELMGRGERLLQYRSRLLAPTVEAVGGEPAFVLVLTAGPLLDLADCLSMPWTSRLVVADVTGEEGDREPVPAGCEAELLRVDPSEPEALMELVQGVVVHRYRALNEESAEVTAELVRRRFGVGSEELSGGAEELWGAVEKTIGSLDEPREEKSADDPLRWVLGTIRWRAEVAPDECAQRLTAWFEGACEDLGRQVAAAGARMLFKRIGLGEWKIEADVHGSLFRLGEPLAKEGWIDAQTVLMAAFVLIEDAAWRARLLSEEPPGLLAWLHHLAPDHGDELRELAFQVAEPEEGETASAAHVATAEAIRQAVQRGVSDRLDPLPEGHSYQVLVLDAAESPPQLARRVRQVAAGLLSRDPGRGVRWVVGHLGRLSMRPVVGGGPRPDGLRAAHPRPRLIVPLLEALPDDSVCSVLVLATGPITDELDLETTAWLDRLVCQQWDDASRGGSVLTELPDYPAPVLIPSIVRYLGSLREGEVPS